MSADGTPHVDRTLSTDLDDSSVLATPVERAGKACDALPGTYAPLVDRSRCEAKAACVEVCPYAVFEVRQIDETEYKALPLLARVKVWAHGKRTAYAVGADACRACGLCVTACPEHAITLVQVGAA
jgi:4Fe-4S ferredoxin